MPEEQETDHFFNKLDPLPTTTQTAIPIVSEQQAAEMRRVEEERKKTQDKQPPEVEIVIEVATLEEVEAILKKRLEELLGYGITKEDIEAKLNAFRTAWFESNDKRGSSKVSLNSKKPQHPHLVTSHVEKESRGSSEIRQKWKRES